MGRREKHEDELNLVPIMNLVTILIPFLLMAASFVNLAAIDSTLPAIGQPDSTPNPIEEPPLTLTVAITHEGFTVKGNTDLLEETPEGEEPGPTVPCLKDGCPTPDSYDTKGLTEIIAQIKNKHEDEENVILVPEATIPYEIIIMTMDATREDPTSKVGGKPKELFPYVVLAGGAG